MGARVVIEAVQFTRDMAEGREPLPAGVKMCRRELSPSGHFSESMVAYWPNYEGYHKHVIETIEGNMDVQIGDWIITGVKGEKYPCKPDIFVATYEAVD